MSRSRRWPVLLAVLGYAAALAVAAAVVELRPRREDPASVAASAGMHAFGDAVELLALAGVLSLAPTWVLVRALRGRGAPGQGA